MIEDIRLVQQTCSWAHVAFSDASVADFFDAEVEAGRRPAEFGRIWVHTHPGNSAEPSQTDEATFGRVFGNTDWAVMFILARGGQTTARLRYHVGPGADLELPVEIDYTRPFHGTEEGRWQVEYDRCVRPELVDETTTHRKNTGADPRSNADWTDADWLDAWYEYADVDRIDFELDDHDHATWETVR